MHHPAGQRRLGGIADLWQVVLEELAAALDVGQGEFGAVAGIVAGVADVTGVVEQGDDHPEHGAARAEPPRGRLAAVVAVEQARHGQGAVQAVLGVVIPGIAAVIARQPSGVELAEGGEGVVQGLGVEAGIAGLQDAADRFQHLGRVGNTYAVGHVVMIATRRSGGTRGPYRTVTHAPHIRGKRGRCKRAFVKQITLQGELRRNGRMVRRPVVFARCNIDGAGLAQPSQGP